VSIRVHPWFDSFIVMHSSAVAMLKELVSIPSVSDLTNRPLIDYARRWLDGSRWDVSVLPYTDEKGVEKVNLVAATPREARFDEIELALVCHTDTVPYPVDWLEAVHPKIVDRRLYGRGSCDVKGFLSCILAAVEQLDLYRIQAPLAVVLTADEEIGCIGAKRLLKEQALKPRYAVVGEPTQLCPVIAGKGYGLGEMIVQGKAAHSAFPQAGRSAIVDAATLVGRINSISRKAETELQPQFDPPFTTINIGTIVGGTAKNVVPAECRFLVEWRPVPGQDEMWIVDLIKSELNAARAADPGLQASFQVIRLDSGFATSSQSELVTRLARLSGERLATVPFGTEAPYLTKLGAETVVFGPGDMKTAHSVEENVQIDELERCVEMLTILVKAMCF
jgi:acetylornithine deacetylase